MPALSQTHPPHPSRKLLAACLGALTPLIVLLLPTHEAHGQGRAKFAIGLKFGGGYSLETYVENKTVLRNITDENGEQQKNIPFIGDLQTTTGSSVGLYIYLRDVEFSVNFYALQWGDTLLSFQGDASARMLDERRIDDSGIIYRPSTEKSTSESVVSSNNLSITTFDVGYRYYFIKQSWFEAFIPFAGGLGGAQITSTDDTHYGPHVATGVGADVLLGNFAVGLDFRLHALVTENAAGVSEGTRNAVATSDNVWSALISATAFTSFDISLRYAFN